MYNNGHSTLLLKELYIREWKMKRNSINAMLQISLFSALMAVCAMISIPFTVPLTLQTFAIFLALFTLGGAKTLVAILVYVALGIVGLPVFAGFGSGIGYILGASGGFVLAFPIAAAIFLLLESVFGKEDKKMIAFASVSLLIIYTIGSFWFALVYSSTHGVFAAFAVCALPYVLPDAVKLALAYVISKRLKPIINVQTRKD